MNDRSPNLPRFLCKRGRRLARRVRLAPFKHLKTIQPVWLAYFGHGDT